MALRTSRQVQRATVAFRRCFSTDTDRNGILVCGGTGFVGSHVLKEAVKKGIFVASLSRRGKPDYEEDWMKDVKWLKGSVSDSPSGEVAEFLGKARGVISCVGAFGSDEYMEKVNGDANIAAVTHAKAAGIPRFVFISAHNYKHLPPALLHGYFHGKRRTESCIKALYNGDGTVLQPGMVYGSRKVKLGGVMLSLPLSTMGVPLEMLTNNSAARSLGQIPLLGALLEPALVPPVPATAVARASVEAVLTSETFPEMRIMTVDDIMRFKPARDN